MSRLTDQSIVITGAASGIGKAIATAYGREGAQLVLADLNEAGVNDVASHIRDAGGTATALAADATSDQDMQAVVDTAVRTYGRLDVMHANAGVPAFSPLDEVTLDMFQRVMTTNAYSVIVAGRLAAKVMKDRERVGKIVVTGSVTGKVATPGDSLYSASKFAVRCLTEGMAKEYAPHVTVNALCPGVIDTPLWEPNSRMMAERGIIKKASDAVPFFGAMTLLGRPGQPEELTGLAVFLASRESDYINGQSITIDGGYHFS